MIVATLVCQTRSESSKIRFWLGVGSFCEQNARLEHLFDGFHLWAQLIYIFNFSKHN